MQNLSFNPSPSYIMHIDLNSCFATIEQQANPHLRGKTIAVAAYDTPNGCILAPSVEAKRFGVKTGMRVSDGKLLCPSLIILRSDPWKYRSVHLSLKELLSQYTNYFAAKSIDEFVLDLKNCIHMYKERPHTYGLIDIGREIKKRIKTEIGDWLTVSTGISTNRFLAKLASNLKKPDGLEEINKANYLKVYGKLELTDLPYIKTQNAIRLAGVGIHTVLDFYHSPLWKLKAAFESINGYYWYTRLRGFEVDDITFGRKSYGNSYALPKPLSTPEELSPILAKLVTKMSARFRHAGYKIRGIHLAISYRDGGFWHQGKTLEQTIFDTRDIYKKAYRMLLSAPCKKPVRELAVSAFNLVKEDILQLELFSDAVKKEKISKSVDRVNERFGSFVITPARMIGTESLVPDRIAFGGVKELEEFTLQKSELN